MKLKTLEDLLHHELKDLYSAEGQLEKALPKMIDAANDKELQNVLSDHLKITRRHRKTIEKIADGLGFGPGGHKCKGMEGLIKEGDDLIKNPDIDPQVLDAAIIASAQRVEHYEMAGYGVARTYASKLGHHDVADDLQKILEEEGEADRTLTRLAERKINFEAMTT